MKLPFRRKSLTADPGVVESLSSRMTTLIPVLGGDNRAVQTITRTFARAQSAGYAWMYANSPAVRTVVDLISRNIGQLDLRLYEEIDESQRELRADHPAARTVRFPSATQTSDQWVRGMVQDFLCFNNAYSLKFGRGGGQLTVKQLPAHRVEVLGDSLFDPVAYRVWRTDGTYLDITDPTDMIHWRGYNPEDPRIGLSPLETLRNVIAEDAALQAAIVELSKAGLASPSWVFRPADAPEWSNQARKGFEEDLTNRLKRSNRKPVVMEEGMELRPMGVSPRDAQMLEVRKWAIHQVAVMYGVPLGMVGLGEGRASQPDLAQSEFYADTLPPICESFTKQLGLSILQQEYGETDLCFEFNLDEKHMGDNRLAALTSATGRPVLTTNEGRAMLNKPPIDGGDELVTPLNVMVGDNPRPSPAVMPIQDPNKPPQDGSHRNDPQLPAPPSKALTSTTGQVVQLHPRKKADMERQRRYIDEAKGVLESYYRRQREVLTNAKSRGKAVEPDSERWNRELGEDLGKFLSSVVEREAGIYVARLGGADFDMRQVQHYIKATAEGVAEALNEVTARDLSDTDLSDAMSRARGERAAVAAASIGARATVFARYEAAKQAPDHHQRLKTWVADTDRHAEVDGETVPIEEDFSIGFEPGSAINCQCSLVIS